MNTLIGLLLIAGELSSLERAYLKELTFLKTEKAEMEKRATAGERETERILEVARADLAGLKEKVVELRRRSDSVEEQLRDTPQASKEKLDAVYDAVARVDEMAGLVGSSVANLPVDRTPSNDEVAEALRVSFVEVARQLELNGKIRREKGVFYDSDGKQIDGEIVRVGDIAAYGVADQAAGALVPAGQGHIKLAPVPAAAEAREIASGRWPAVFPIFLVESFTEQVAQGKDTDVEKEVAARAKANMKGHGIVDTLMGLPIFEAEWVLYLLMILSVVSVGLMIERGLFYRKHAINIEEIRVRTKEMLGRGDFASAADYLARFDSLETNVALFGLREHQSGPDSVEDLLRGAEAREKLRYNRWLSFLATVGSNSPFIGLFGTVLGIIRAFGDLAADAGSSGGSGGSVMGGISEALIATAVGLLVAIPAVIAYNAFVGKVKTVLANSELLSRTVLSALKAHDVRS